MTEAADIKWSGTAGDGQWGNPLNWVGDALPGTSDQAIITTNGFGTATKRIFLGADRTINSLRFNDGNTIGADDVVLDGEGTYTLTLRNGNISGPAWGTSKINSTLACDILLGASGLWTLPQAWQSVLNVHGRVIDNGNGYGVTLNGNQNEFFNFGGVWDIGGSVIIRNSGMRLGGVYTNVQGQLFFGGQVTNAIGIYLDSSLAQNDYSDTTLTIENTHQADSDRVQGNTRLGTLRNGGNIIFTGHATAAVAERVARLDLQSGRIGRLSVDGKNIGLQTDLIFESVDRASGTSMLIEPRNGGRLIFEGASNVNGIWHPWCFDGAFYTKVGDGNAIVATVPADYTVLGTTGNDPLKIHRFSDASLSLGENVSVWGLRWDRSSSQTLDLGVYGLTIGSGAMIVAGVERKTIISSGGQLIFAGEDVIYNVEGSGAFTNSAPVAWAKPSGSSYTCPSLVFTRGYRTDGIVLDGEDHIGNYSNLNNSAYYSSVRTLTLAGPSDRTFHGPLTGIFNLEKRGSGTLTFNAANLRRGGTFNVYEGRVIIGHASGPAPTIHPGGRCEIAENVSYNNRPVIEAGGILGGSGALTVSMGTDQIKSGARLAPGTSAKAGRLAFNNTVGIAGDLTFDIKIDAATNDNVRVVNTFTLPPSGSTFTFRVSDLSNGAARLNGRTFVVVGWAATLGNAANTIHFAVENASPASIDTSNAVVTLDPSAKTITLSGLRTYPKGTVIKVL
jgi:autotransporter-associated beta strand protein